MCQFANTITHPCFSCSRPAFRAQSEVSRSHAARRKLLLTIYMAQNRSAIINLTLMQVRLWSYLSSYVILKRVWAVVSRHVASWVFLRFHVTILARTSCVMVRVHSHLNLHTYSYVCLYFVLLRHVLTIIVQVTLPHMEFKSLSQLEEEVSW